MTILSEELPESASQKGFLPGRPEYERLLKADAERALLAARLEAARQALEYSACLCWRRDEMHDPECRYVRAWREIMSIEMPPLAPE